MKFSCFILLALLACAAPSCAQTVAPDEHGAYLSGQLGNGLINGGNATGDRQMQWLAFEARLGRDLNPAHVNALPGDDTSSARIDFVYYNEGHPDNNRRDGFAVQLTYARKFGDQLAAELSAGPYTSMNTTTLNGVEIDQAKNGVLTSVALRYRLPGWARGAHLRLAYNHVWMHDAHHSDALMLGVGRHFTDNPPRGGSGTGRGPLWLGAALGRSITNQSGTDGATGAMLQARQELAGGWAASVSAIEEGDDGRRVDRHGVAAQAWIVQPLTAQWTGSAGLGPYLAKNRRSGGGTDTHALFTMQLAYALSKTDSAFFAFNRVKTFQERNDRDLFQLGWMRAFGP
jgi:hypothetical protein